MFYVYCITSESSHGGRYIGFTEDLKQRVADHNHASNRSTRIMLACGLLVVERICGSSIFLPVMKRFCIPV